jgi:glycogen debranching enzyme
MLLSSSLRDDNASLICDLSNPDLFDAQGEQVLKHDRIHLRRVRLIYNAAVYERILVRNFDEAQQSLTLSLSFKADYADVFEVRGSERSRRGVMHAPKVGDDSVMLAYTGLDHRLRQTRLRFCPPPSALNAGQADFALTLAPGESCILFCEISCLPTEGAEPTPRAFFIALRNWRNTLRQLRRDNAHIVTSNNIFNEAVRRNVADLYMLTTQTPEGLYPYAGIPWFSTVFGRDALITGMQTLWLDPNIALGVLRHLAANQAVSLDAYADAEPGKILHEVRRSEMAELREVPFRRYYGSVDSTPLFIMLAGDYLERTGQLDVIRRLWPNIEAALDWIHRYGDRDGDGFVEYFRQTDTGLANQGWKDSHDSVSHADGSLATGPIALVEVQAYVYGAWRAAAEMARRLGNEERAASLDSQADALKRRFDSHFFDEELGSYVLALDGDKKPCRVLSSNAGHALFTGIALPERAPVVMRTLMTSFSGFGIRTLAATEKRYNPMSYHNGSVWPHDNAIIAAGFARYGFRRQAAQIFEGLFAASTYTDLRRLPELFCGFLRRQNTGPVFYPVACTPQAWATAAPFMLLQACLGLSFAPEQRLILFNKPVIPDFLEDVALRDLKVGDASADVAFRRSNGEVVVQVLGRHGDCRVATTL